jgi:hypothetical protein
MSDVDLDAIDPIKDRSDETSRQRNDDARKLAQIIGQPIVLMRGSQIVRFYPDGREEIETQFMECLDGDE